MTVAEGFYYSGIIAFWLLIILFIFIFIQLILVRKRIKELKRKVFNWRSVLGIGISSLMVKVLEFVKNFVTSKPGEGVGNEKRK